MSSDHANAIAVVAGGTLVTINMPTINTKPTMSTVIITDRQILPSVVYNDTILF